MTTETEPKILNPSEASTQTGEQESIPGSSPFKPIAMSGKEGYGMVIDMSRPGTEGRDLLEGLARKVGGPVFIETNDTVIHNQDGTEQTASIWGLNTTDSGEFGKRDESLGLFTRVWDDKDKGKSHIERVTTSRPTKPGILVARGQ